MFSVGEASVCRAILVVDNLARAAVQSDFVNIRVRLLGDVVRDFGCTVVLRALVYGGHPLHRQDLLDASCQSADTSQASMAPRECGATDARAPLAQSILQSARSAAIQHRRGVSVSVGPQRRQARRASRNHSGVRGAGGARETAAVGISLSFGIGASCSVPDGDPID